MPQDRTAKEFSCNMEATMTQTGEYLGVRPTGQEEPTGKTKEGNLSSPILYCSCWANF